MDFRDKEREIQVKIVRLNFCLTNFTKTNLIRKEKIHVTQRWSLRNL